MKKCELLAPAGDLEKLKIAVHYGADAVYFGGEAFSLRAGAGNLSLAGMGEGVRYAHERNVRCYLTINIFAHNDDIEPLREYLKQISSIPIDAFLVSDPGVMVLLKEMIPEAEIHLSTQANMTNYVTASFWKSLGVKRIVLARELSFPEIREIRERIPEDMDLEAFVHGAMCISYSGRCLLSNAMTGRDANRGLCAHPCRYQYALMEEKRPGEYYPIEEDVRGTYIMNSKDLCMIRHIPELVQSGICSLKIEGRMKSIFYVAQVVRAYRQALDAYEADPENWSFREEWLDELSKASHREFTTGFYFHEPSADDQNYRTSKYIKPYVFTGLVLGYDPETRLALVEQRNKMVVGDELELFGPGEGFRVQSLKELYDAETGEPLDAAPHPQQLLKIRLDHPAERGEMLRRKVL